MKTPEQAIKEFVEKWGYCKQVGHHTFIYKTTPMAYSDFIVDLAALIEGMMPTVEEIIEEALTYVTHKSLKTANKGLIKDAYIIGQKALRSRILEQLK